MKISDAEKMLVTLLDIAIDDKEYITARLLSPPGVGKSSIVKSAAAIVAKQRGIKIGCKVLRLCEVEQPDVKGYGLTPQSRDLIEVWAALAEGKELTGEQIRNARMQFSLPSFAWDKERDGEYGFLFLDEQPQANDDVNKVAAEIMLDRRVGDYQLPPGVIVVAAGNREQDKSGARKTMAFIQNRIMDITVEANKDALVDWMERNNIHHSILSFTEAFPSIVMSEKLPEKPSPFCTPRSICNLSKLIDKMPMAMFTECAQGLIGEGAGAQFVAHLRVVDELPSFEQIIAYPLATKIPEKPDAAYATMRMVSHNVNQENAMAAFQYLARMKPEFQAAALRHSVRRTPQIVQHKEFATWLRSNKKLLEAANLLDKKDGK